MGSVTTDYPSSHRRLKRLLRTVCDSLVMLNEGTVDKWLNRAAPALMAAAIIGLWVMWGDVQVIKATLASEERRSDGVDAAQNASILILNRRMELIESGRYDQTE